MIEQKFVYLLSLNNVDYRLFVLLKGQALQRLDSERDIYATLSHKCA